MTRVLQILLATFTSISWSNGRQEVCCLQLCCPAGQLWAEDQAWVEPRCGEGDMEPPYTCALADENLPGGYFVSQGMKFDYRDNSDPSGYFHCPSSSDNQPASLVSVAEYYQTYSLSEEGHLLASYPGVSNTFNSSQFCLVHLQVPGQPVTQTFRFCLNGEKKVEEGKDFTKTFYSTAIIISSIFLSLTLIAYLIFPDLHRPLFGKITIGFIINNIAAYIASSFRYLSSTYTTGVGLNSVSCILVGYTILYTFTSLMFWINAMAANIFFKFSYVVSPAGNESSNFKFYIIYAQGTPLLLAACIALVDSFGPCDWILPSMGAAQCFLGSPWERQWSSGGTALEALFLTSEFIYFHSILLLLQGANIVFFLLTLKHLINHWRMTGNVLQVECRTNFLIVVKLFFIMGIPWLGEFLSHMITDGTENNFWFRVFMDLLNLFSGVLVFLVLVCKVKMFRRVVGMVRGAKYHRVESTMTTIRRSSGLGDRQGDRQCGSGLVSDRC